jgi:hypothetical protein
LAITKSIENGLITFGQKDSSKTIHEIVNHRIRNLFCKGTVNEQTIIQKEMQTKPDLNVKKRMEVLLDYKQEYTM